MQTLVVVSCSKVVYCKAVDFVGWSPQLVKKGLGVTLIHHIRESSSELSVKIRQPTHIKNC